MSGDYDYKKLYDCMASDDMLVRHAIDIIGSNKKRLIAMSMFMMVSADKRALGMSSDRPTIWSSPKGRRDTLVAVDSRMSSQKTYDSNKRNYNRYLDDLERTNVMHVFGVRDMNAYCIEPYPLSWTYCNENIASLFPISIIRLIDSRESLFMSFMSRPCGRNITYDLLMERFAQFVAAKRERLHPSVQRKVPKLTDDDYEAFIIQVRHVLLALDPLDGKQYVKFKMNQLPDNIYSAGVGANNNKFAELIPRDSRVSAVSNSTMHVSQSPQQGWAVKMTGADGIPNMDLDIIFNPMHLLQLLERDIKRKCRIPADRRVFTDYSLEADGAERVWRLLDNVGVRNYDTIRRWTSWYARKQYDKDVPVACGLEDMSVSWNKFTSEASDFVPDYHPRPDIVEHLNEIFYSCDRHQAVQEASLTYGFCIAYAYTRVKYGMETAKMCFGVLAGEMETLADHNMDMLRKRVMRMMTASTDHFYRSGSISTELPNFVDRIKKLREKAGFTGKLEYCCDETAPQKHFWDFVASHAAL